MMIKFVKDEMTVKTILLKCDQILISLMDFFHVSHLLKRDSDRQ